MSARYDADHIRPLLRADDDAYVPRATDLPVIERMLPKGERLSTLMRLFLLGVDVAEPEAAAALEPLPVEHALRLGLIQRREDRARATVRIAPSGDVLVASDRALAASELAPEHVMGAAASSRLLAGLTVRRPVARALDVGCGCGIEAILAARHAERVIATDINPRALTFTAFNAALNGVDNVECRAGSFFEPVAGETFDLIVCNPPFVISPDRAIVFRDAGLRGDEVSRLVLRESVAHLRDGGLAFVMIGWGIDDGGDWRDHLRRWSNDLRCDVWFLHHSSDRPLLYAASWNSPIESRSDEYAAAIDRWTAYLAELGFAAIGYGAAILRKRGGLSHWRRFDELRGQEVRDAGDQVARLLDAQDRLAALRDPRELLDLRLALEPDHQIHETLRRDDGALELEGASLSAETGLRFAVPIDAQAIELIASLDGRTLRDVVQAIAERRGITNVAELESSAVRTATMLVGLGFARVL